MPDLEEDFHTRICYLFLIFSFLFFLPPLSHVAQAGLELAIWPRMTLNSDTPASHSKSWHSRRAPPCWLTLWWGQTQGCVRATVPA